MEQLIDPVEWSEKAKKIWKNVVSERFRSMYDNADK